MTTTDPDAPMGVPSKAEPATGVDPRVEPPIADPVQPQAEDPGQTQVPEPVEPQAAETVEPPAADSLEPRAADALASLPEEPGDPLQAGPVPPQTSEAEVPPADPSNPEVPPAEQERFDLLCRKVEAAIASLESQASRVSALSGGTRFSTLQKTHYGLVTEFRTLRAQRPDETTSGGLQALLERIERLGGALMPPRAVERPGAEADQTAGDAQPRPARSAGSMRQAVIRGMILLAPAPLHLQLEFAPEFPLAEGDPIALASRSHAVNRAALGSLRRLQWEAPDRCSLWFGEGEQRQVVPATFDEQGKVVLPPEFRQKQNPPGQGTSRAPRAAGVTGSPVAGRDAAGARPPHVELMGPPSPFARRFAPGDRQGRRRRGGGGEGPLADGAQHPVGNGASAASPASERQRHGPGWAPGGPPGRPRQPGDREGRPGQPRSGPRPGSPDRPAFVGPPRPRDPNRVELVGPPRPRDPNRPELVGPPRPRNLNRPNDFDRPNDSNRLSGANGPGGSARRDGRPGPGRPDGGRPPGNNRPGGNRPEGGPPDGNRPGGGRFDGARRGGVPRPDGGRPDAARSEPGRRVDGRPDGSRRPDGRPDSNRPGDRSSDRSGGRSRDSDSARAAFSSGGGGRGRDDRNGRPGGQPFQGGRGGGFPANSMLADKLRAALAPAPRSASSAQGAPTASSPSAAVPAAGSTAPSSDKKNPA